MTHDPTMRAGESLRSDSAGGRATVAFLFTDVEGSTARWEADPLEARDAIDRQERVIRDAVEAAGGTVFKTVGDGVCAAFGAVHAAVGAALDAQRALLRDPSRGEPLRVRMAVHVGAAEPVGDDYVGPAVNRVARVLGAAHGGQILLSSAAAELARDRVTHPTGLLDLGEYELAGVPGAQRLFQLVDPALPARFPPLKAASPTLHNLPAPPDRLVGRDIELATIRDRLVRDGVRLLTLTGTGGSGKTRLALAAAAELLPAFTGGVFLVELGALEDASLVLPAVARTLGLAERGGRSAEEELHEHLRERRTLLVLDNFEQLLDAAPDVSRLLAACPRIAILATTRAPLRLGFERELSVEPLTTADPDRLPPLEELARVPAVALFVDRAAALRPAFRLTRENAADVATICARVDGLPLAVELAAARTTVLSTRQLRERLERGFGVLGGGRRDRPSRHQTMRQAIAGSYELLEPGAQRVLNRVSVFAGGFTPDAVEAVAADPGGSELEILDRLAHLQEMSLLRRAREEDDRLTLLETIRDYARERLTESGDDPRPAHARWFLELAEASERGLRGEEQTRWIGQLDDEHDNLRAALRWAIDTGQIETALRMATALWRYWELRGHVSEGRRWLDEALAAPGVDRLDPSLRARALCNAASLTKRQGDLALARRHTEEAAALARTSGDRWALAAALNLQGMVAYELLDVPQAIARYEESLPLFRELGDRRAEAYVLGNLGLAQAAEDASRAVTLLADAVNAFRAIGDTRGLAGSLNNLGSTLERAGRHDEARRAHEESLSLKRALGGRHGIADSLTNLASLALAAGDARRAEALYDEALPMYAEMRLPRGAIACVRGFAALAAANGDFRRAARLLGAAERLGADYGVTLPPTVSLQKTGELVEKELGPGEMERELARGRGIDLAQILEERGVGGSGVAAAGGARRPPPAS